MSKEPQCAVESKQRQVIFELAKKHKNKLFEQFQERIQACNSYKDKMMCVESTRMFLELSLKELHKHETKLLTEIING